jgi:WD40 repeat protein
VAFSPDGQRLAVGNDAGAVKIWDVATGKELRSFQAHPTGILGLAFRADGGALASAGLHDRTVKVWDAGTGRELFALRGHNDDVSSFAFTPDGRRVLSAGGDPFRVWDATTPPEARFLGVQPSGITSGTFRAIAYGVAFSQDGQRLASFGTGEEINLWDVASGRRLQTLRESPRQRVVLTAFGNDDRHLNTILLDDAATVWDLQQGKAVGSFQPGEIHLLSIGDQARGPKGRIPRFGPTTRPQRVRFSRDGRRCVCLTVKGDVTVWDVAAGQVVRSLPAHQGLVGCVTISDDGTRVASAGAADGQVVLWDVAADQPILTLEGEYEAVLSLAFSPDNCQLAVGCNDGVVHVVDTAGGREAYAVRVPPQQRMTLAYSPDGARLALGFGRDFETSGAVRVWDASTGQELLTIPVEAPVDAVAFSPDGQALAAIDHGGVIRLFDGAERSAEARAAALEARTPHWHRHQARKFEASQNWFAAAWHLERLPDNEPASANVQAQRVRLLLRAGAYERINAAAADTLAGTLSSKDDVDIAYHLAWLHLQRGDQESYRRLCRRVLDRYEAHEDAEVVSLALRLCVLGPDALGDPERLVELTRRTLATYRRPLVYHYTLGGALYRAGRYEEAARALQEALKHEPRFETQVLNWLYLALTHHKMRQTEEAQKWLARAEQWITRERQELPETAVFIPRLHPRTSLSLPGLHREAKELLSGKSKS